MKKFLTVLVALAALKAGANAGDFERYRVIMDRKPFGEAPPEAEVVKEIPLSESFAKSLRLCAITIETDGRVRAGITDDATQSYYRIFEGETEDGMELLSIDPEAQEAVLSKNGEMAVVTMKSADNKPLNASQQQEQIVAREQRRLSYAERRAARRAEAEARRNEPPPESQFKTQEALQQHLQQYQMEVIRQGLPALPIPLTQEMDDQLVAEGVLPPIE
ncbi:MAG: hypothetical protein AB7T27_05490 [Kiritimatiellia bacterium]